MSGRLALIQAMPPRTRFLFPAGALFIVAALAQSPLARPAPPPTLGLENGVRDIATPDFTLRLASDAQVAVGLLPKGGNGFDFAPSDRLDQRASDGFYHLGDFTFRARRVGAAEWTSASTATKRQRVAPLAPTGSTVAAADLTATLPADSPVKVVRRWTVQNGRLALLFDVKNPGPVPVEVGALGIPVPFNNIITGRTLEQAHAVCSFTDPYIGQDAGYLQVTRLTGTGPTMVVTPVGKTPLEAYRLLIEPMRPNQTFEGMMEWMVHTDAYAQDEWEGVPQWNSPTKVILKPGETRTYGVRFQPSESIRAIERTLQKAGRPVAVGLPGYVLPMDQDGKLFLKYGKGVESVGVEPKGALSWRPNREGRNGWKGYTLKGRSWGRARLTITYADDTRQTVSYVVIKPAAQAVADMGSFLTTKSWFTDEKDRLAARRRPWATTANWTSRSRRTAVSGSRVWVTKAARFVAGPRDEGVRATGPRRSGEAGGVRGQGPLGPAPV